MYRIYIKQNNNQIHYIVETAEEAGTAVELFATKGLVVSVEPFKEGTNKN